MLEEMEDLLRDYNAQHYLFVDSDCVQMSEGPQFTKEETIERLRKMPTLIEMPWNEVVQNYIDRYSQKLRRHVSLMLGAQNLYMQIFEEALETYGLPLELRYLPVIESALNPNAVSHAGAGGLWQFMAFALTASWMSGETLQSHPMPQLTIFTTFSRYSETGILPLLPTTQDLATYKKL